MRADASRLLAFMEQQARYRDRTYFAADDTAAAALGVCRRTVIRWRCQLESDGLVERDGYHVWGPLRKTVRYRLARPNVTQRPTGCKPRASKYSTTFRTWGERRPPAGRGSMRGEVRAFDRGLPGKPNATVGQALYAAVIDELRLEGVVLPPRLVATAVKQGKEALDGGVDAASVLAGAITALRLGKARYTTDIIGDIVMARAGRYLNQNGYRMLLLQESAAHDEAALRIRAAMEAARQPRGEIER